MKNKARSEDHMNLIMVASPLAGAGKTFCSVNLAASISLERELNVLLVDADVADDRGLNGVDLRRIGHHA